MPKTTSCKKCGATIIFIKLDSGKWMPLDTKQKTIYQVDGNEIKSVKGYEAHWATCPDSEYFRKKGGD